MNKAIAIALLRMIHSDGGEETQMAVAVFTSFHKSETSADMGNVGECFLRDNSTQNAATRSENRHMEILK